ncbi:hypothetical protein ABR737_06670 [Streptomyces sp. Edi2]|uniref:hypothetical protein n=1 Tax=Streptomyces sp. Edi2 TaxID=3162528 RepID=UPI0033055CBB
MPFDVYAALGALVRAEARRTKPVPAPTPADHAATQQPATAVPQPAEPPAGLPAGLPAEPSAEPPTEPSGAEPRSAEPPSAVTAALSSSPARKGLLRRMMHRLAALLGRGRPAGSGVEGRRPARARGAGGPERHRRQDGARPAEPPSGSPLA